MAVSLPSPLNSGVETVRSLRSGLAAAALAVLVVGGTGCLLIETSLVASSGYENARLLDHKRGVQHRAQELEAEVASLRSLDYVEREAKSRMGMVPATSYIYVHVDPSLKDPR